MIVKTEGCCQIMVLLSAVSNATLVELGFLQTSHVQYRESVVIIYDLNVSAKCLTDEATTPTWQVRPCSPARTVVHLAITRRRHHRPQ